MERVVVEAPATSANLGPGFDVFALALKEPVDRVSASVSGSGTFKVRVSMEGDSDLPADPRTNSVGAVALAMGKWFKLRGQVAIKLTKGVPVGVGLGSSGASSAASAVAMNHLFGLRLPARDLVQCAGVGEKAASGAAHLDNVSGAILGGFVIVPKNRMDPVKFDPPSTLKLVVVTPMVELPGRKTEFARSLVPKSVEIADVVANVSNASRMVAGFAKGNVAMIGEAMEDFVVEPSRAKMIPGLSSVKSAAKRAGAAGICISGAGPSVLSLVDGMKVDPEEVMAGMRAAFDRRRVRSKGFVTGVGKGVREVEGP